MIALLFSVVLVGVTTTPTPTPEVSLPCAGKCLAGISIGDDRDRILRGLDSYALPGSDEHIMSDFNSYADGLMLAVYYQRTIVAVSITYAGKHGKTRIIDPYGVRLEDTTDQLTACAENPT